MSATALRVAVLGCGHIAMHRHIPALRSSGLARIVAVADIRPTVLEEVSKRFGIKRTYMDYKELLEKERDLDVVDIALPVGLHAQSSLHAIEKGLNVIVEKPMATTYSECSRMIDAARARQVKLSVCHTYRFYSAVKYAKRAISAGLIGDPVFLVGLARYGELPVGGSKPRDALWEVGPHFLDVSMSLLGDIEQVQATASSEGTQGQLMLRLEHSRGWNSHLHFIRSPGTASPQIAVWGSKGALACWIRHGICLIDKDSSDVSFVSHMFHQLLSAGRTAVSYGLKGTKSTPYYTILSNFLTCVRCNVEPPVPPTEAARIVAILESAESQLFCRENP